MVIEQSVTLPGVSASETICIWIFILGGKLVVGQFCISWGEGGLVQT